MEGPRPPTKQNIWAGPMLCLIDKLPQRSGLGLGEVGAGLTTNYPRGRSWSSRSWTAIAMYLLQFRSCSIIVLWHSI